MVIENAGSDRHREQLQEFGEFIGADKIRYVDFGNGELYVITKGGKEFELRACGNKYDGGFLAFGYAGGE